MEKRKLTSLRMVLLRYLVKCIFFCVVWIVGWFLVLAVFINSGWALPANRASQVSNYAAEVLLPAMTSDEFDPSKLDPLCRYVLYDTPGTGEILATNLDSWHLKRAKQAWEGEEKWELGYTQYYVYAKLRDGKMCQLQYDFAVHYANPKLQALLPDLQMTHFAVGALVVALIVAVCTHQAGKFLARETVRLTEVSRQVAEKKGLEGITFTGAQVREYDEALRALQLMSGELTESLQRQWQMEQQQREQIIQLAHELKTPLTVIQGNAELLAEDEGLTEEQKEQIAAILSGVEQTRRCTLKIRAEVQTPLKYKKKS